MFVQPECSRSVDVWLTELEKMIEKMNQELALLLPKEEVEGEYVYVEKLKAMKEFTLGAHSLWESILPQSTKP